MARLSGPQFQSTLTSNVIVTNSFEKYDLKETDLANEALNYCCSRRKSDDDVHF